MAQHDYVIANGTGAAVRADLNNSLAAIVSNNSGATAPATTYAFQWWADTTTGLLKIRNAANNAFITVGTLADANLGLLGSGSTIVAALGSASTPGITFTGDLNTGFWSPSADTLAAVTAGSNRLHITSGGLVGIGTATPDSKLSVDNTRSDTAGSGFFAITGNTSAKRGLRLNTTNGLCFDYYDGSAWSQQAVLTSGGNVGIGTTVNITASALCAKNASELYRASDNVFGAQLFLLKSRGTEASPVEVNNDDQLGQVVFQGYDGTAWHEAARIAGECDGTWSDGGDTTDAPGRLVFYTTANGANTVTERMRISSQGQAKYTTATTSDLFADYYCNGGAIRTLSFEETANTGGVPGTSGIIRVSKNNSNNRSVNATGTINASGADYAEYMTKSGIFDIAKGAICGVNTDGLLTLNYGAAVNFAIKSTNPSYVGNDTWCSAENIGKEPDIDDVDALAQWKSRLEAARINVDRVAFAGQVPVNVTGATPGQYIVPVESADGGIEGIAKDEADLTLTEYMRAVGKVIAIEDDGRARVIVKVA